ncbi:hypothetical protein GGR50DRAFT_42274 [Xylaria sp. CBS 124048]|nr:hypothetical protein GGR50DRAFT_42274 [Xylaria sp. CBS 124048]
MTRQSTIPGIESFIPSICAMELPFRAHHSRAALYTSRSLAHNTVLLRFFLPLSRSEMVSTIMNGFYTAPLLPFRVLGSLLGFGIDFLLFFLFFSYGFLSPASSPERQLFISLHRSTTLAGYFIITTISLVECLDDIGILGQEILCNAVLFGHAISLYHGQSFIIPWTPKSSMRSWVRRLMQFACNTTVREAKVHLCYLSRIIFLSFVAFSRQIFGVVLFFVFFSLFFLFYMYPGRSYLRNLGTRKTPFSYPTRVK